MKTFIVISLVVFSFACGSKEDNTNNVDVHDSSDSDAGFCGDGIMNSDEECDDGNTTDNDVCVDCRYVGPVEGRPKAK